MAEPHMVKLAEHMLDLYESGRPAKLTTGEWHLPLIKPIDESDYIKTFSSDLGWLEYAKQVSAGRCARVSYLTHHGTRDPLEDIRLCTDLRVNDPMHASPLEHPAMALGEATRIGNYTGWMQYRKMLPNEYTLTDRRLSATG